MYLLSRKITVLFIWSQGTKTGYACHKTCYLFVLSNSGNGRLARSIVLDLASLKMFFVEMFDYIEKRVLSKLPEQSDFFLSKRIGVKGVSNVVVSKI